MSIVDIAWQIIVMDRTINSQRREIERLTKIEKEYEKLSESSMNHAHAMHKNMLNVLMAPGVVDALRSNTSGGMTGDD